MKKIPLNSSNEALADEYENDKDNEWLAMKDWASRLVQTRDNVKKLQKQYRKLLYQNLQEAYEVYTEALQSPYSDSLFKSLRYQLYKADIKFNKKSPDAGILIKYISAEEVSNKTVHDWSSALIVAERNNVPADQFANWIKSKTITGAVKERKQLEKDDDDKKDRMDRARRIVLRLLEGRETKPLATFTYTAHKIERNYVSATGLVVALGTARRKYDRESFYGDVNLALMFAPSRDFEIKLLDHLAKELVDRVEYYERKFDEMDEQEWGEHVWERLVAPEEEIEATQTKELTDEKIRDYTKHRGV